MRLNSRNLATTAAASFANTSQRDSISFPFFLTAYLSNSSAILVNTHPHLSYGGIYLAQTRETAAATHQISTNKPSNDISFFYFWENSYFVLSFSQCAPDCIGSFAITPKYEFSTHRARNNTILNTLIHSGRKSLV